MIKAIFRALILPIALAVVLAFINATYFKEQAAIKVFVSTAIPISGTATTGAMEFAQQISVANQGNANAKQVSIKVPRDLISSTLEKHSNLVKEEISVGTGAYELVYPDLPPEQKFSLLIRYRGLPLDAGSVGVSHSQGVGYPALDASDRVRPQILISFLFGLLVAWLGWIVLDIRRYKKESFVRWSHINSMEQLLKMPEPWYFSSRSWPEAHRTAIEKLLEGSTRYSSSLTQNAAVELLNSEKPTHFKDTEWSEIVVRAQKIFTSQLEDARNYAYRVTKFAELFALERPSSYALTEWERFRGTLTDRAIESFVYSKYDHKDMAIVLEGKLDHFDSLPEAVQEKMRAAARSRYFVAVSEEWFSATRDSVERLVGETRVDLLSDRLARQLKTISAQVVRMHRFPRLWPIGQDLRDLVGGAKPEWLSASEFDAIKRYVQLSEGVEEAERKIAEARITSERVLRQLNFIDDLLANPSKIERVEEYEDTFSKGNYENLRRISVLIESDARKKHG